MALEFLARNLVVLVNNPADLIIQVNRGRFTVVFHMPHVATEEHLPFFLTEGQRTDLFAHPPLADHFPGDSSHPLKVITGATGHRLEGQLLGNPATEQGTNTDMQALGRFVVFLLGRQVHGDAHGPPARND